MATNSKNKEFNNLGYDVVVVMMMTMMTTTNTTRMMTTITIMYIQN